VRAMRAPCRSRVSRPTSGSLSTQASSLSRTASRRRAISPAATTAARITAISQPQSRIRSDRPMTSRVNSGRVWPMLSN